MSTPENPPRIRLNNDRRAAGNDLPVRIASAMVMVPAALAVAWIGGVLFVLFWCVAAILVFWEWSGVVAPGMWRVSAPGIVCLAVAGVLAALGIFGFALVAVALGAIIVAWCAPADRRLWAAIGVPYASIALLAPSVLRADPELGLAAILLLFAVVWLTDILGYFVGRLVGGAKLWPKVSPAKTWSGALGALAGAVLIGLAAGSLLRLPHPVTVLITAGLSVAAQAGDLTESAIKRRFGVKDVSHLIPGHGGLMDRLDGFLAAALIAAMVGVARGGVGGAARGLLSW